MSGLPPGNEPRGLSVRATFGLLALVSAAVVAALSLLFVIGVVPQAARVRTSTAPIIYLVREMRVRAEAADQAVGGASAMMAGSRAPRPRELDRLRAQLAAFRPTSARRYADVPPTLRAALARVDDDITRVDSRIEDALALAELGRLDAARGRLALADSIRAGLQTQLAAMESANLDDLLAREADLQRAAGRATWIAVLLVFAAVLFPVLLVFTLLRRIDRPLQDLSAGLDRVGTGDLTAEIAVRRPDELGRLADHFNAMTRILRDRAEGQGHFAATGDLLAGMAHEVNNPLQAITALAESRLDEEILTPAQRADYQLVLRQGRRAAKLLAGLLRYVRPGQGAFADLDLADVAARVVDLLSYQFGVDEIRVDNRIREGLPKVRGEASRLEQLLVNLLSNAIDAVREIAPPRRITLEAWEHEGTVHVAVADNGPGIAAVMRPALFQPFVTTKGKRGTGLGLYVSRQQARELGGDLELRSAAGEGARFVAWFPAAACAPLPEAAPPAREARPAPARVLEHLSILVVDDEETIRRLMSRYLQRLGATVVEAGDGLTALTQLGLFAVDAAVLDLRMPRMNGIELYTAIRTERPELTDRIVFLSGDPLQLAEQADALPPDRVLAKPIELAELTAAIRRVTGR